ncbi:uncharacterized protein LOC108925669 [Scleropages formosus]|uniref:uncharacterized protein LOC108925669 n=1 Tax=Scleropages formosus TaxID=113540 RepID=UPI0008780D28|nr:uncharacterized protein LOC108925669 [Scleropages formosus]
MTSYLSGDGVLSVEAPLPVPEEVVPEKTVIPIQVGKEKVEEKDAQMEEHARREEESDPADPFRVNRQASGEEPEYGDTAQQAPGVVPTEPVAGAGEEAGHPGDEHLSPEQQDEIRPAGGVLQEPLKQKPIEDRDREDPQGHPMQREELGEVDSEASGAVAQEQLDEPVQEGAVQKDAEGEFMEGPPGPSEECPPERAKPDSAQSEKYQSPELEVLEGQDIEQAEEPPTKS